ncbi:MAG: hypothetical protein IKV09_00435 [Alistipes sp.]|nr:hypothetical protein [Alistipes sp.]
MWQDVVAWIVVVVAVAFALVWGYKRLFCNSSCDDCLLRKSCNKQKKA